MIQFASKVELKDAIKKSITSSDSQAIKAMLRIYEYQTADEQSCGGVISNNGVGFAGTDSEILTSFCHQYQKRSTLSPKQIAIIKKKIGKYAGQLMNHAIENGIYIKKDGVWCVA